VAIFVRRYRPSDLAAVDRITTAAYGHPMNPGMESRLAAGARNAFVAEHDGTAAGFVMATDYGGVAYVASMGVDPAYQRLGIARAMMTRLVEQLERAGVTGMLLDATGSGAPLYESFGFAGTDRTLVYERQPRSAAPVAPPPISAEDLTRAETIDREICGCDRGAVLRAFADEPGAFLILHEHGYAIAREHTLGPWVARSPDAARALLHEALGAGPALRRIFIPECNRAALQLAESSGFVRARSLRHMERGPSPFQRTLIFGQASLGHG
jgi:ribosomal protein S18 acetylase RimI-like enzyme